MSLDNLPTDTNGVKGMTISGRMVRERERLMGMTDAERAWRAQWLKDQILAPDEPVMPKNYYTERYNIIRRFYRYPLECAEAAMAKTFLGPNGANFIRLATGRGALGAVVIFYVWYHMKYSRGDWMKKSSWKLSTSKPAMFPDDPGFPNYPKREAKDYVTFGFDKSPI